LRLHVGEARLDGFQLSGSARASTFLLQSTHGLAGSIATLTDVVVIRAIAQSSARSGATAPSVLCQHDQCRML
jgi:hypothetical protein